MTVAFTLVIAIFLLAMLGTVVQAAGLVDDTVNVANEYSRYPLENYQLDFYVDNSWGWLPWNWSDGIGKQVMYGLYAITNFIWTISLYVSNATGYLVQEAYSLDFISATADSIGKNMQTLAGVTPSGLSTEGFYVGFLFTLDFGSWGLCCLYRTDKERNHKGNSCPHEFCAGFYPIGFLYCLCSRLY
ncbi:Tn916 ORF15 signal peptide containing protein [Streptococcus pneumoniae]|nr:Tn916 ORF15 signal peptide containing protein [Streptococcus pneumoniae]